MSVKVVEFSGVGDVSIVKKRGMRSMRLRVKSDNSVVVSAPWFVSQREILGFIDSKKDWIISNQTNEKLQIRPGMPIGLAGVLSVEESSGSSARVMLKERGVKVRLPGQIPLARVEGRITSQITKYLSLETEESIFPRLLELSNHYDLRFNQVKVKKLSGRWGSCDSHKNIVINAYLIQLEEELIDYVLVHELAHTRHLNHSKQFWDLVGEIIPDYKQRRKALKSYQPRIYDQSLRPRYNDAYA